MIYEQITENKRKSFLLLFLFIVFIVFLGWVFGEVYHSGETGIIFAVAIAIIISFVTFFYGDKMVLGISQARPVDPKENPYLNNTIEGLAIAAGVPAPKAYIIDDTAPNAFATGRNPQNSAIAVTTGLLQKMNRLELEGVIAHEMSHIKNYDIRYSTLVVVLVGTVALLSDWMGRSFFYGRGRREGKRGGGNAIILLLALILVILAPIIAKLLQLAISRQKEYLADSSGALLTRYPEGLASALEKISKDTEPLEVANKATAHLYIVNPLLDHRSKLNNLFDTHPPTEERVKRLRAMSFVK
jgi:heat shock protein HtpX